jgi:hypothetical protein
VHDPGPEPAKHAHQPRIHAKIQSAALAQMMRADAPFFERRFQAFRKRVVQRHHLRFEPVPIQAAGQRHRHALGAGAPERSEHLHHPDLHFPWRAGQ